MFAKIRALAVWPAVAACASSAAAGVDFVPHALPFAPVREVVREAEAAPAPAPVAAAVTVDAPPEPDGRLLSDCRARRSIVVHKAARRLELWCGDALAARYETSLGFAPAGSKEREGDGKTPEGEYRVTLKYRSKFHRSLQLDYPNAADAERGLREGLIGRAEHDAIVAAERRCGNPPQDTALGSFVQIHGGGGGRWAGDWTLGCVAVDDPEIEQIEAFQRPGCDPDGHPLTPVIIRP